MLQRIFSIVVILLIVSLPCLADLPSDVGQISGSDGAGPPVLQPAQVGLPSSVTAPAGYTLVNGILVQTSDVAPTGVNLTSMISQSGPWDSLNPTAREGETRLQAPFTLVGLKLEFQQGRYTAGKYVGYLEKGSWLYAWWSGQTEALTIYKVSRGDCGNPDRSPGVYFGVPKPKKETKQTTLMIISSTAMTIETVRLVTEPAKLSFAQRPLTPDRMPTKAYGEVIVGRLGVAWFNSETECPANHPPDGCYFPGGSPPQPGCD